MQKIVSSLLVAGALATPFAVFAQAKNFQGFTAGLSASSSNTTTKGDTDKYKGNTVLPTIELGYAQAISEQATIGITATYDLDKTKSGSVAAGYNIQFKNHYSVNFQPGYAISKELLVYGILGVHQSTISVTGSNTLGSKTFTGYGYGLGAQYAISKELYLKVEAQQVDFQKETYAGSAVKASSTLGTVGVGYKF
jgi:opacity protein-like surface antigen